MEKETMGEYDERLLFLTEAAGQLTLKTRGSKHVKSKLSPWLKLFSINELVVVPARRGTIDLLISVDPLHSWEQLYRQERRLLAAHYLSELVQKASWPVGYLEWWQAPEAADNVYPFFSLLKGILRWLENTSDKALARKLPLVLSLFEIKVLKILGFGFATDQCPVCGRSFAAGNFAFFDEYGSGVLCGRCGRERKGSRLIPMESVRLLHQLYKSDNGGNFADFSQFSEKSIRHIRQVLPRFIEYVQEQEIHSKSTSL